LRQLSTLVVIPETFDKCNTLTAPPAQRTIKEQACRFHALAHKTAQVAAQVQFDLRRACVLKAAQRRRHLCL